MLIIIISLFIAASSVLGEDVERSPNVFCKLDKHPSVTYQCLVFNENGTVSERTCNEQEPVDTEVKSVCNSPNYYSPGVLPNMECEEEGSWSYVATCSPECGRVTPSGSELLIDGVVAQRSELPWHVSIYRKTTTPYQQICGGSIIRSDVVLSAAHCFWSELEKRLPAETYAVAAGKLYRPWNDPQDVDAQKSDVKAIQIPARFHGFEANYQDDIAMVSLTSPFEYRLYVRPVCLDFDLDFDRSQLMEGNSGKVATWRLTSTGKPSPVLQTVNMPNVKIDTCIADVAPEFREYITSDKICAGFNNGTALCKGDSGNGLAFPVSERGTTRYYLRGIAGVGPATGNDCSNTYTTFTQISKHEHFIKEFL